MKKLGSVAVEIASKSGEHIGEIHIPAEDVKLLFDVLGVNNLKDAHSALQKGFILLWLSYMLHLFVYHDLAGDLKEGYDYICAKLHKALERKEKKNV